MSWEHWGYLGLFLILLATGLGLPLPEDVPLLTGGYLCYAQGANVWLTILVAMVGVLGSDLLLFTIGRRFGHHVVEYRFVRQLVNPPRLVMAERLFARHGVKIIFAARFMPPIRGMTFMAAGVLKVPFATFLLADGSAALLSVPTLVLLGKFLGRFFGDNLEGLVGEVQSVTHTIVLVCAAIVVLAAGLYLHRRQKRLVARAGLEGQVDARTLAGLPPGGEVVARPPPEPVKTVQ
ncbi:MAG TPA: DedA family protein [Phycisphaerae bacterium]|nr:DedA family protein [Phycisphaerae bacterium]HRY67515.1 DedA family protein [Phycisphaerae bacterium]HSA24902.1 DedA family protein [Phycisphaerae bacterium]